MLRIGLATVLMALSWPAAAQPPKNWAEVTVQERRDWYEQERRREHARTERRDNTIFGDRYPPWWRLNATTVGYLVSPKPDDNPKT